MAYRTWGRVLLAALLVGIVSGAGQLGIAYGLGLVRFNRGFEGATVNHWPAQLGWVGWFAMVAAVAGALVADRLARRYALPSTLGTRAAVSALAALGALAVAPLSMQPARAAQVASADPVSLTGVAAVIGAGVGFVAALAALSQRPVVWNIGAVTGAVWFLAVLSVLPSLGPSDPLPAVRLGGVDPSWLGAGSSQRLAVVTMPALALIAGALTGALARRRELPTPVVASCGVAGPAMLALAYVVAGRGDSADAYQAAPYWGALTAVGAGALGSALAAWARWPLTTPASTPATGDPTQATGDPTQATGVAAQAGAGDSVGAAGLGGSAGTTAPEGGTAGTATAGIGTAGTATAGSTGMAATGSTGTATVGGDGGGTAAAGSGGGGTAGANDDDDAPTDSIPTVNTPSGTAGSTPSWRLDIPHPERPTADTGTGTGTTPTGTWTPGPAAAGGRTYGEPTEPYREQPPSTGNWSFDIGRGIPSPRASTEDSAPTERYGSPAPTVSESGQWSNTEPPGRAGAGSSAASADAEPSAGWSGARRLRTEDFWPTTTPPSTPTPPAPATTPPAPVAPPTPTSAAAAPPEPPARTPPPIPPSPRAATSASAPASPARSDDVWDAFAPVIRPRADRLPPIPVVSGNTPVQTTPDPGTPLPVAPAPEITAHPHPHPHPHPQPQPQPESESESESGTEDAERPTGRIRRGLFRRNRGSADSEQTGTGETGKGDPKQDSGESKPGRGESKQREAKGRNRTEEPVPARDEEYVDWVSGLSEPDPNGDDLGLDRSVRRSLRSTGRHHAD